MMVNKHVTKFHTPSGSRGVCVCRVLYRILSFGRGEDFKVRCLCGEGV